MLGDLVFFSEHLTLVMLEPATMSNVRQSPSLRLWPRASAVAERLWSSREVRDKEEAAGRLQEMECRMLRRGYRVSPVNGPDDCGVDWSKT